MSVGTWRLDADRVADLLERYDRAEEQYGEACDVPGGDPSDEEQRAYDNRMGNIANGLVAAIRSGRRLQVTDGENLDWIRTELAPSIARGPISDVTQKNAGRYLTLLADEVELLRDQVAQLRAGGSVAPR